ncbi:hypothetical protein Tco_0519746 [Tanacetum coccineum]
MDTTHHTEEPTQIPYESPLHSVHSLRRDKGSLSLNELTVLCTSLSEKVASLESELKQKKVTYSTALTKLILRVKNGGVGTASESYSIAGGKAKDKGKQIMQEPEPPNKLKKRVQVQMSMDEEIAKKMFEEEQAKVMTEQEQERMNLEAALELQRKLNAKEEVPAEATQATQTHEIDWNDPSVLRYHAQLNRPYSVAEVRKNTIMYLKNQGGYKMSYFKGMKYEDI